MKRLTISACAVAWAASSLVAQPAPKKADRVGPVMFATVRGSPVMDRKQRVLGKLSDLWFSKDGRVLRASYTPVRKAKSGKGAAAKGKDITVDASRLQMASTANRFVLLPPPVVPPNKGKKTPAAKSPKTLLRASKILAAPVQLKRPPRTKAPANPYGKVTHLWWHPTNRVVSYLGVTESRDGVKADERLVPFDLVKIHSSDAKLSVTAPEQLRVAPCSKNTIIRSVAGQKVVAKHYSSEGSGS